MTGGDTDQPSENGARDVPEDETAAIDEAKEVVSTGGTGDEDKSPELQRGLGLLKSILARLRLGLRLEVLSIVIGIPLGIYGAWMAYHAFETDRRENVETSELIKSSRQQIIEEFEASLAKEGTRLPPDSVPTMQESLKEFLKVASEQQTELMAQSVSGSAEERADALTELSRLAEDQERAIDRMNSKAAITYKAIGAAAFLNDTALAVRSYEAALRVTPHDPGTSNQLGHLFRRLGDLDEAHRHYASILEEHGSKDASWKAASLGNLGMIELTRGNLAAAQAYFERSLAINEQLGLKRGIATSLGNLGVVERTRGNLDDAKAYFEDSLTNHEQLGNKQGMATQLGNLGLIELTLGNLDAAEAYLKRSFAIDEQLDRKEGMAIQLGNLGVIERTRGNLDAAEAFHERSLTINEQLGRKEGMAANLSNLGAIEQNRGNLDAAEAYHKRSLTMNEQLGSKPGIATQLGNLGVIETTRGNLDAAVAYHKRSLTIEEQLGRKQGMAADLGNLGAIEQTRGNLEAAEAYYERSLTINEQLGHKEGMAIQLANLGLIEQDRSNLPGACSQWKKSQRIFAEIGNVPMHDDVTSWMAADCQP